MNKTHLPTFLTWVQSQQIQIVIVVCIDVWMQLHMVFRNSYIVFSVEMFIISHWCFASHTLYNVSKSNQPIKSIVTDEKAS